ncbi:MAG: hypothetical protein A3H96_15030 [Acidobacteria bacterium RIFCSPLOWO2_02_FULL_67_36]|nr:MAG: hypothetical protein A3H96_15030 [Acidobacteria bacterium RIFCSPLOWO2_02_FULL_67_36]OFW19293.1 MAG: hypothetical protein A3G21_02230 [Acidobacteria bacterium RIFCSPLOWO2_12_FULL_66_21]
MRGWDYSTGGAYFVTICAYDRLELFGEITNREMHLSAIGNIVADSWRWLASQYPYVTLDEWCVMPDHLHGILILSRRGGSYSRGYSHRRRRSRTAPTRTLPDDMATAVACLTTSGDGMAAMATADVPETTGKSLSGLIAAFKTVSTKHVNRLRNRPGTTLWQRSFWERIVRDDVERDRIRLYIRENAARYRTRHHSP